MHGPSSGARSVSSFFSSTQSGAQSLKRTSHLTEGAEMKANFSKNDNQKKLNVIVASNRDTPNAEWTNRVVPILLLHMRFKNGEITFQARLPFFIRI
jgi:hypothetical protein